MASESLEGQTALVTGAGRGLGRGFAIALAEIGMKVGITARTSDQLEETASLISDAGGACRPVVADMSDPDSISGMVTDVVKSLGAVHLLVNNAGDPGHGRRVWEVKADDWWYTHDRQRTRPAHLFAVGDTGDDRAKLRPDHQHIQQ